MRNFKIGINMAGAVSAGAYTAGVLDFLLEALEEWHGAKQRGEAVPAHDVSIEVLSGASAGGMCAAISAVQLTESRPDLLHECWVNRIDIRELLGTRDLHDGQPLVSLLDSTPIGEIARCALAPGNAAPRPYVSSDLTILLSLTNLRGVPYSLNGAAPGSLEQTVCYYGDRVRFRIPLAGADWLALRGAAMATGAFPLFLAPRVLTRATDDYFPPLWDSHAAVRPDWPFAQSQGCTWDTLNVDGGLTDNDPFQMAHDHLMSLDPPLPGTTADLVDRAVVTIAPFPSQEGFDPAYEANTHSGILGCAASLLRALLSQSRFFGESLAAMTTGADFTRFVIAPSDAERPGRKALQCSAVSAFGGFFDRGFREHDYQLGRRNCQQFLRCHFVLPEGPIVPLCGSAAAEVPVPQRAQIRSADLDQITGLIVQRFNAILPYVLQQIPWAVARVALRCVAKLVAFAAKGRLRQYLEDQLSDA